MKSKRVKLVSNNIHNFRHGIENPVIIGVRMVTPEGFQERLCYRVLYSLDYKIDYVPVESVLNGDWTLMAIGGSIDE